MGFVGINESGKSNVLEAIRVLGGDRKLKAADEPKMAKGNNASILYKFTLTDDEFESIQSKSKELFKKYIPEFESAVIKDKIINYKVEFDREKGEEYRYFDIPNVIIEENLLILLPGKIVNNYPIKTRNGFKDLKDCLITAEEDFQCHIELEQNLKDISYLKESLSQKQSELDELIKDKGKEEETGDIDEESEKDDAKEKDGQENYSKDIDVLKKEIEELQNEIKEKQDKTNGYKLPEIISAIKKKNAECDLKIKAETENKNALGNELKTLKDIQTLNAQQTKRVTEIEDQLKKTDGLISSARSKIADNSNALELLGEEIQKKYTSDRQMFINFLLDYLDDALQVLLPKVVFWEYDDKYLQESVVNLDQILQVKTLSDVPRPLLNMFRISYSISTIDELKLKIKEAQDDISERSRISDTLTEEVNNFLQAIWADYKQNIKIVMEKNEMLVQIFDPEKKGASYYSFAERSQGFQTFISFLLTIGVEAKRGVLKNTILLLDEPETHLHPSGVKFMLKELIRISNNNTVFYATHSMFMIDRNKFERHVIVKKTKEVTDLEYALKDRIGSFMQEEVLYGALTIEWGEFDLTGKINFVFEGYGDTLLFNKCYNSASSKELPFKLDECVFHHGGGCTKIREFLNKKPIKMETKWIFILDSDKPAEELKRFIENKYEKYLKQDVFIFQYSKDAAQEAELEDLLPDEIKLAAYNHVLSLNNNSTIDYEKYTSLIEGISFFCEQYKEICSVFELRGGDIKGYFKEALNLELENGIKDSVDTGKFKDYYRWFKTVLDSLKENKDRQRPENA
jgi:AAA15 family ATPase/GTPase